MSTALVTEKAPPAALIGSARSLTLFALAMATFMQVLDSTIANVSIPTISGDLGVSPDQGTWIITSFAVANGVSVPLTGWLMQRYGVVRVFVLSVLLFTIASFLCGIAWSLPALIVFRVLQGAVSGPMVPGSQALLIALFPPARKGMALMIWSMTTLIAPICGPILGGWISDNYAWAWIFLINVPVGLACAAVCWGALKSRETATRQLPIDKVGLVLLFVWVGALQIALDKGKDLDWFGSTTIIVLALVALIGFAAWLIWEREDAHPIVDLSLFASRNFTLGTIGYCLGYAVFFGNVVLLPLWLQTQMGYTATWAGLVAAPSGLTAVLISPLMAKYVNRVDARWFATIAFAVFGISYLMRARYTPDASFEVLVLPLLVQGVAMGLFFVAMLTIILDRLPPERIPAASGLTNFIRITGGSFATSITTTMWDRREALHQSRLVETLTPDHPAYAQTLDLLAQRGAEAAAVSGVVLREVVAQSYLMASEDIFRTSGWIVLALIPLLWLARRPRPAEAGAAAAD